MPDEDGFPTLDELKIQRDEEGNILPVEGETPQGERIRVKPMSIGAMNRYLGDVLRDPEMFGSNLEDLSWETRAQMLEEFYVKPDFTGITTMNIEQDFDQATLNDYLVGLFLYSGHNRDEGEVVEDGTKNK